MRQLTCIAEPLGDRWFSKLPMRQLTPAGTFPYVLQFSKLPMRQLTLSRLLRLPGSISKLPMRQLTITSISLIVSVGF